MDYPIVNRPITAWATEDRPREKMEKRGVGALSDAELVATLLATGTRELSAIALARKLINHFGSLGQLARAPLAAMMEVKGIGPAKATTIVSAFELSRRRLANDHRPARFSNSNDLAKYLMPKIGDQAFEVFYVIFLDRGNGLIGEKEIFRGGNAQVSVDGVALFKEAVTRGASSVVVSHNHPSGRATPSKMDDELTEHLLALGRISGITLVDHIIVTHRKWYSYRDMDVLTAIAAKLDKTLDPAKEIPVQKTKKQYDWKRRSRHKS